jgi:hypothetical protein
VLYDPGLILQQDQEIYLISKIPRLPLEPTQPRVQWVLGYSGKGVRLITHLSLMKRLRRRGAILPFHYMFLWPVE